MNVFLIAAGTLSAIAAILHLGCIYFGASWYRLRANGIAFRARKCPTNYYN